MGDGTAATLDWLVESVKLLLRRMDAAEGGVVNTRTGERLRVTVPDSDSTLGKGEEGGGAALFHTPYGSVRVALEASSERAERWAWDCIRRAEPGSDAGLEAEPEGRLVGGRLAVTNADGQRLRVFDLRAGGAASAEIHGERFIFDLEDFRVPDPAPCNCGRTDAWIEVGGREVGIETDDVDEFGQFGVALVVDGKMLWEGRVTDKSEEISGEGYSRGATADTPPPEGMVFTTSSTEHPVPSSVAEDIEALRAELEEAQHREQAEQMVGSGLPPQPMFDTDAAAESCDHRGCRRKAHAVVTNEEGVRWRACADHYEQDLAAQAIRVGHEPAWRVPIGPDVVLAKRPGGPIGVEVDGQLRNYISAGELSKIFEGPVE